MKQSTVNEIWRMRKYGIRSEQDKKNLWAAYRDIFGKYPKGDYNSITCSVCVTESFWEAFEAVNNNH
jgi:hypothetical protein